MRSNTPAKCKSAPLPKRRYPKFFGLACALAVLWFGRADYVSAIGPAFFCGLLGWFVAHLVANSIEWLRKEPPWAPLLSVASGLLAFLLWYHAHGGRVLFWSGPKSDDDLGAAIIFGAILAVFVTAITRLLLDPIVSGIRNRESTTQIAEGFAKGVVQVAVGVALEGAINGVVAQSGGGDGESGDFSGGGGSFGGGGASGNY